MKAYPGRKFQFWSYRVSHGELLVRSPRFAAGEKNVDIMFAGVSYVDLPRFLPDFEVEGATAPDVIAFAQERSGQPVTSALADKPDASQAFVFRCGERRYVVVASWMGIAESDMDVFDTPFT
jgi:hypothetical protein